MKTRRRKIKKASAPVTQLAFEPAHRELFRMAGDTWTPPAAIKVRHGMRSWTLTAVFLMEDGSPVTLITRLAQTKAGPRVARDEMRVTRTLRRTK